MNTRKNQDASLQEMRANQSTANNPTYGSFGYPPAYHMNYQQGYFCAPLPANQTAPQAQPQTATPPNQTSDDMFSAQAQGIVDNFMGEQAGMFKNIINSLGLNDNEFWKGAMIGAAAALVLSNENVRKTIVKAFSGAGDTLKSAGEKVKETATTTAHSAKEGVSASSKIFRDTVKAGKEGFQQSVEEVKQSKTPKTAPKKTTDAKATAKKAPAKRAPRKKVQPVVTETAES